MFGDGAAHGVVEATVENAELRSGNLGVAFIGEGCHHLADVSIGLHRFRDRLSRAHEIAAMPGGGGGDVGVARQARFLAITQAGGQLRDEYADFPAKRDLRIPRIAHSHALGDAVSDLVLLV
ncbi:MAG TPA: hypothetical protein VFV51_17790 [Vicinamibacterales bacterium]|nr:hypothetical protein [Vicinamibacterales bacterium]